MSERFASRPAPAWTDIDEQDCKALWARFDQRFSFRAGVDPKLWPAIREPSPSVTFDLSVLRDGAQRGAAYDAINAEALRAFVWALPDCDEVIALDWQHPAYRFNPANQALTWGAEWKIPVYPDGDYSAFLTEDYSEGTFGHPWEQTICVMGERLVDSLARSWATWLPVKRKRGVTQERLGHAM
ncbi:Protein of unknown function [Frankineae bacterium MT45]|nr:Protein of unknown function [Frankineae bacterium MT45]